MKIFYAFKEKVSPEKLADYAARRKYGLLTSSLPTKEVCFIRYKDRDKHYVSFEMFDDTRPLDSVIHSLKPYAFMCDEGQDYDYEEIVQIIKQSNHATRLPKGIRR